MANEATNQQSWLERELGWAEAEIRFFNKQIVREHNTHEDFSLLCAWTTFNAYIAAIKAIDDSMMSFNSSSDGSMYLSNKIPLNNLCKLLHRQPLTPIEDTPEVWIADVDNDNNTTKSYQNTRLPSLYKTVDEHNNIKYSDIGRVKFYNSLICKDRWMFDITVLNIIDSLFPISMPYTPQKSIYKVIGETFLSGASLDEYDTCGIFRIITPENDIVEINRFFKTVNDMDIEISKAEYDARKAIKLG
jgi:hypothetical protein